MNMYSRNGEYHIIGKWQRRDKHDWTDSNHICRNLKEEGEEDKLQDATDTD